MKAVIIFTWLLSWTVDAQQLEVTLYSDNYTETGFSENDLAARMLLAAYNSIKTEVKITFDRASPQREWHEVTNAENVCLYNKTYNQQRADGAIFSRYPVMAFPPNRLITRKNVTIPKQLSLVEAINHYQLKIGIVGGRSYGQYADEVISAGHSNFVQIEGTNSLERSREMLSKGRIDGILEYWPTMISAYQPEQLNNFKRHELSEAQNFIFGHLVCSKSQIGAAVIALFDQTMRRSEYFEEIVVQHKLSMPVEEFSAIENALTDIYKESPK